MSAVLLPANDPYVSEVTFEEVEFEWEHFRDLQKRLMNGTELFDELAEAEDQLLAAVRHGDPALIGRVVLAIRDAWAERVAYHKVGFPHLVRLYAQDAAERVLSEERA